MAGSDDFEARLTEVGFIVEQEASSLELAQLSWNGFETRCYRRIGARATSPVPSSNL